MVISNASGHCDWELTIVMGDYEVYCSKVWISEPESLGFEPQFCIFMAA